MTSNNSWPKLPKVSNSDPQSDVKLEKYKAQLEVYKSKQLAKEAELQAEREARRGKAKAAADNHNSIHLEVFKGYLEVAKQEVALSIERADFVQKVSAALGTIYTSVLALSFSLKDGGEALPGSAMLPAIFLGLSFALAAAYVAFITQPGRIKGESGGAAYRAAQAALRDNFIKWTRALVLKRRFFLQSAVVSLGVGIVYLPAPYIQDYVTQFWSLFWIGVTVTFAVPAIIICTNKDLRS